MRVLTTANSAGFSAHPPTLAAAQGSDWPKFLGPSGTSVSSEKGIIALNWPTRTASASSGQNRSRPLTTACPANKGKLYHFDRKPCKIGDKEDSKFNCLTCMDAYTGDRFWTAEYPSVYKDKFGYNTGLRIASSWTATSSTPTVLRRACSTVSRPTPAQVVWRCDTVKEFNVIQNFFGVGSTPSSRRRSAHRPGRRQSRRQHAARPPRANAQAQRHRRRRLQQAHRQDRLQDRRRTRQLFQPGAGDHHTTPLRASCSPRGGLLAFDPTTR